MNGARFLLMVQSGSPGASEARHTMCPLQNLAGVEVDDPVAPSPAAAIGDATVSSVGHRPSSIVAPNRDQQFR